MGQSIPALVPLVFFGVFFVSIFGARLNVISNKLVEDELGLLCEDLETGSLWKLRSLPVQKVLRQANVSTESDIDYKKLRKLLTKSWIDDEFDKQLRKLEKGKMLEMQKSLQVNTLVVIDRFRCTVNQTCQCFV